jgi:competence protein ComEA
MDIYPSLMATLLASVMVGPLLAAGQPATANNNRPSTVSSTAPSSTKISVKKANPIQANVNINTADTETLVLELKGIGQKRARSIVTYREQHGAFQSIDELANVKGISKKIVDRNRNKITV